MSYKELRERLLKEGATKTPKTLKEAQDDYLNSEVDGVRCQCCGRPRPRVYPRTLNSGMARGLIKIYRASPDDWIHVGQLFLAEGENANHAEYSKLKFWGLLEPRPEEQVEGHRSGFWRLTDLGRAFVMGRVSVPRISYVAGQHLLRQSSERTDIFKALGDHYDWYEMMEIERK